MIFSKDRILKILWFLFFFLMIFLPRQMQAIKIGLMALIILYKILAHRFQLSYFSSNRHVDRFIVCWFAAAILKISVGMIRGNPGIAESFRMDIGYVILLLGLFFSIDTREELEWINKVILFSGAMCALYTMIWFLVNIGIWPRSLFYAVDYTTAFGQHEGYTHMTNTNSSTLIPILPMCFVSIMTTPKKEGGRVKWITFFLCLGSAILSGRRMIWAAIPFSMVFVLVLAVCNPQNIRYYQAGTNWKRLGIILAAVIGAGVIVVATGVISIDSVIARFRAVMAGGEEAGERTEQAKALIDGFLKHPLLGSGAGATAEGSLRNQDFTWAYELSYHAILFHSGAIGFALYVFALGSIAAGCIAGARRRDGNYSTYVSLLGALLMGYIANASNPYFSSSFDFLWWILWPVGYCSVASRLDKSDNTITNRGLASA